MSANPAEAATELLVIRHGETDWNRQLRFQGQIDVPLNANGLAQAQRLGRRLAQQKPWDVLLCSDLQRTQQTAAPFAQAWGLQPQLLPGFREQNFGQWEGLDVAAIQARHGELWPLWLQHDGDFALPGGGESLRHFHSRVMAALREAVVQHAGRRVVVVTHGGVLDMLWRSAHSLPISGLRACEIPNTGLNLLRWLGGAQGSLQIDGWADDTHLVGLPDQPSTAAG